jgi:hypothetical protein
MEPQETVEAAAIFKDLMDDKDLDSFLASVIEEEESTSPGYDFQDDTSEILVCCEMLLKSQYVVKC